jgi:hypothetical protein
VKGLYALHSTITCLILSSLTGALWASSCVSGIWAHIAKTFPEAWDSKLLNWLSKVLLVCNIIEGRAKIIRAPGNKSGA